MNPIHSTFLKMHKEHLSTVFEESGIGIKVSSDRNWGSSRGREWGAGRERVELPYCRNHLEFKVMLRLFHIKIITKEILIISIDYKLKELN